MISHTDIIAEWGQIVNVPISIIRNKTLAPITDVGYTITGLPDESFKINITDGTFVLVIDTATLEQLNKSYVINMEFRKDYYVINSVTITLTVTKVNVEIRLGTEIPNEIYKIPFVEEQKMITVDVGLYHKGVLVEDAKIYARVYSVDASINRTIYGELTGDPGHFRIAINWGEFPPGYKYTIEISVEAVKVYGRWIPVDKISYQAVERVVLMDYLYGSTKITIPIVNREVYAPNMILYPLEIVGLLLLMFFGYKLISFILTPPEVREINRLLKLIEKGVFEYEVPRREEFILDLLSEELGIKIDKSQFLSEKEEE